MLLENRVAIVTGGTKGMGKAIAEKFASEGCDVVITSRHLDEAQKVAKEIEKKGRKALGLKADISKSAEVNEMAAQTIKKFKKIDILVNNAGGIDVKGGDTTDATEADWDHIIDINLKGCFLCCMAVVPYMKKQKYGKIINLSSMGAVNPAASVLHYHAAKAGVLGLTINLAFELAPDNIYCNAIVPGPIETPFWDSLMDPGPEREKFLKALAKQEVPLGRIGTPKDIAGPALFLASGLSDYVTGQTIYAAGGQPLTAQAATFLTTNRPK